MAAIGDGRPGPRTLLLLGAKIAFSVALLWIIFRRIPLEEVRASIRGADPAWLLAAAGMLLLSNFLGAFQWSRLLHSVQIPIPLWKVLAYYHVGLFFNNFLPANVGGDIARVYDASRYAQTRAAALATVLLDRMIGTVALAGLAVVTTLPAIDEFHLVVPYLFVLAFFVLASIMLYAILHPRSLQVVERLMVGVGLGRLRPALDEFADRLAVFRGRPRLFLGLLAVALAVQVMRIFVHVLVARALSVPVPLPYFFLFVPLLAVIVSLPISLNGIGVREGAGVLLFGLVGVDRAHAFSLQFTTYLVGVAVSLLGAVVFLVRIPHRRAEARQLGRNP
jgi:hypothetical protein